MSNMMALKPNFYGEARNAMEQSLMARECSRKRRGIYMFPISDDVVAFVGLNESKWRGETRLEIIPVIGVVNLRLLDLVGQLSGKSQHPLSPQIGKPLGYLMPNSDHRVWKFTPDIDIHVVAEDLAENVIKYGVPWVRQYNTLETLFELLLTMPALPGSSFNLPCALLLLGRKQEAEEYVSRELDRRARQFETIESPYPNTVLWFKEYRLFAERIREKVKLQ